MKNLIIENSIYLYFDKSPNFLDLSILVQDKSFPANFSVLHFELEAPFFQDGFLFFSRRSEHIISKL